MITISRQYDETNEAAVSAFAKELGFFESGDPENPTPISEVYGAIESLSFERFDKAFYNTAFKEELVKSQSVIDAAVATADAVAQIKVEETKVQK